MRGLRLAFMVAVLCTAAAQAAPGILEANSANPRENDGSASVLVQRRHGSDGTVTVDYATRSASAVAGRDFSPVSGTLTFLQGETSKLVPIAILDNATYDGQRKFFLDLSNPTGGATIATYPIGDVEIYDDEPPPSVSIDDISVVEGDAGQTGAGFTISITGVPRSIDVRIFWTTNGYSVTEDTDFEGSGGSFWFTPADTQKTVSVPVNGDTAVEEHEKFNVYIYGGAAFTRQYGYCTILDDDTEFQVLATDAVVIEGNTGTASAVITLTAAQPLSGIPVQYATVDGTAAAGSDFPHTTGTVWFWGELVKQITIPVHGDTDVEPGETFTVHLSSFDPRVTLPHPDAEVTIVNDDVAVPSLYLTFAPAWPKVYVGQTLDVRVTASPLEQAITLPLLPVGGKAGAPASVTIGPAGGVFTLRGLAPGSFAIEFTLPGEYGGGIARLYGTVESGPRQKRAIRMH